MTRPHYQQIADAEFADRHPLGRNADNYASANDTMPPEALIQIARCAVVALGFIAGLGIGVAVTSLPGWVQEIEMENVE